MTKELDVLIEHIEGLGGLGDASMSLQKNSVIELEEGIWTLSERCGNWKVSFWFLIYASVLNSSFMNPFYDYLLQ